MDTDEEYYSSAESTTYSEFAVDPPTKRHVCTFKDCNKAFFRPSKLTDHQRRHFNERPFICDYENCEKSYHNREALKKHYSRVHLKQIETMLCPVEGCSQEIQCTSFKKHMLRKHNNFRRYKYHCIECHKGFSKETHLKNHSTEHVPIYTCDMCQKVFKQGHRFRAHVKNHKKYECVCKAVFHLRNKLLNHEKTCEYLIRECQICGATFSTRYNYSQHHRNCHTDKDHIESFKCSFDGCLKQYKYKKNLNMHMRKNHKIETENEEPNWECDTCGKSFKTREYMKKHFKKFHLNPEPKEIKLRKPRFDKGIPKIPMITQLTGVTLTREDNRNRIHIESQYNAENLEKILKCDYYSAINIEDSPPVNSKDNSIIHTAEPLAIHTEGKTAVHIEEGSAFHRDKGSAVHTDYDWEEGLTIHIQGKSATDHEEAINTEENTTSVLKKLTRL